MRSFVCAGVFLGLAALLGGPGSGQVLAAEGTAIASAGPSAALSPAPDFSEKDIFGNRTIALKDYRGKVVVLNFWATWCPPCREEIPALKELESAHKGRVAVIGVSVFCSESSTEQFYKDYAVNYPMFYGFYMLLDAYGRVRSIPTTFIINQKGEIAVKVVGSRTREQYEELLKPLLDQ